MKKFIQDNKKLLLSFLFLVILFPTVILVESPIGIIPTAIGETIISYGGAILGGFLTLYGVWWTIEVNKEKEREDKALQYRPVLQYDICENTHTHQQNGEINFWFDSEYFDNVNREYLPYMIRLENVGRGEIEEINFKICDEELIRASFGDYDKYKFLDKTYFLGNKYINFIPINGVVYIQIGIPKIKREYISKVLPRFSILLKGTLSIQHKGLLSERKYNQSLVFHLSINYNDSQYTCEFYNTSLNLKILSGEVKEEGEAKTP